MLVMCRVRSKEKGMKSGQVVYGSINECTINTGGAYRQRELQALTGMLVDSNLELVC